MTSQGVSFITKEQIAMHIKLKLKHSNINFSDPTLSTEYKVFLHENSFLISNHSSLFNSFKWFVIYMPHPHLHY